MSFSDLAWEEKSQSRTRRHSPLDFDHGGERLDFFSDLPDWREVRTPIDRRVSRFEFFDGLTIFGYFAVAVVLVISAVVSLLSNEGSGAFLLVVGSLLALFLAVGRIIEVRWRGLHDI